MKYNPDCEVCMERKREIDLLAEILGMKPVEDVYEGAWD